jgi:hypothetical protein
MPHLSFLLPRDSHSGLGQLKDDLNFDPEFVEKYIELLCEFSPEKVYPYIVSSEGYRLDNALQVCHLHVMCVMNYMYLFILYYVFTCNFLLYHTFCINLFNIIIVASVL